MKYYSVKNILKQNAVYNVIVGERSNGKTYSTLEHCLKAYLKDGNSRFVYLRRWKEDITTKRMNNLFSIFDIQKMTKGKFNTVIYKSGSFYLANEINEKNAVAEKLPFCYVVALSDMEHDKSVSFVNVKNIVFDEFLTRQFYIRDEFVIFMNVISTVARNNDDVHIFMLGNTVNTYSPYFEEMGITNIKTQKQGTIDVYRYANDDLTVAVEYCANIESSKKSNKYFAFDNPRLEMIKGGKWELGNYKHLPSGYKILDKNIIFTFAIRFNSETVRCDIIDDSKDVFLYITKKTTDIKDNMLSYCLDSNETSFYKRNNLVLDNYRLSVKIRSIISSGKVYYQNNTIGEIVRNYFIACKKGA